MSTELMHASGGSQLSFSKFMIFIRLNVMDREARGVCTRKDRVKAVVVIQTARGQGDASRSPCISKVR